MNKPVMHPELLSEILAFCQAQSLSKADFGKNHMGDPRFVYDIEAGRECRRATVLKVKAIIEGEDA